MKAMKPKKNKLSVKQKVAFAVFMEVVPAIIEKWSQSGCEQTFDEWLMDLYKKEKERKNE